MDDLNQNENNKQTVERTLTTDTIDSTNDNSSLANLTKITQPEECIKADLILPQFASLTEDLICCVCKNIAWNPTACAECSSVYGKKCLNNWLMMSEKCVKQCDFKPTDFPGLLNKLLGKILFYCINKSNGCEETIKYYDFYTHVNSCNYGLYACNNEICGVKGLKDEMVKHSKICEAELNKCSKCGIQLNKEEMIVHSKDVNLCIEEFKKNVLKLNMDNYGLIKKNFELESSFKLLLNKYETLKLTSLEKECHEVLTDQVNKNQEIVRKNSLKLKECIHYLSLLLKDKNCMICLTDQNIIWSCPFCKIFICVFCLEEKYPNSVIMCDKNHALKPFKCDNSFKCNCCKLPIANGITFRCQCNYNLDYRCYKKLVEKNNCLIF